MEQQNAVSARDLVLRVPLTEVGNMIQGVPIEVKDMKYELENIQAFIYDAWAAAEENSTGYRINKKKLNQLIEASFRMEDDIDEYMIREEWHPCDPGCAALSCEVANFIRTMILRHQIKGNYQDFKSRVREIVEIIERDGFQVQFSLEQGPSSSAANQKATVLQNLPGMDDEADDVVGFDAPRAKLIGWLVKGREQRTVISVVGMGGLGKTTLAKQVYDSKEVATGHFNCRAWITMSQLYTLEGLLRDMLSKFYRQTGDPLPQDIFRMDRGSLIDEVRNYLQQKRYVVFFDDVWNVHFWDDIEFALIDNKNGSRILITTRKMDVALYCKRSSHIIVHELQSLTPDQSLELFNEKAFRFDFKGNIPKDLINISSDIVKKCQGLPLAIVVIGGLLSHKDRDAFQWQRFSENLSLKLEKDFHFGIRTILGLSYYDLPYNLKLCLLYFGIYPEDSVVQSMRLIRQWIAEGFVKEERGKTLEEVAEGYLTELIHRSLVQVSSISIDGRAKSCHVHDLLRELILEKFEDLSFCNFISKDGQSFLSGLVRRLSVATASNDLTARIESSRVRSLLFFTEEGLREYIVRRIPTKYKLLRVLDFESAGSFDVPRDLGNLIYLKYLSFRKTGIQSLPKSIGELQNLETLDLRGTGVHEMPKEVSKLIKLRHLLGDKMSLTRLKGGIGGMASLQTLSVVQVDEGGIELIKELGKLTQLRKLSLFGVREEHGTALCSSISEMQHLEKLHIETKSEDAAIDLSLVSCPPYMLRKLRLHGKLNKLPWWIPELHNLVELSLSHSRLTDDPLKSLKDLPNLLLLNLAAHSYEGECLHFQEGGFQVLKELGLRYLHGLSSIIIDEGALCSLKELTFMKIPKLKKAPSGMLQLQKLEVLKTHFMPTEFEQSIAPLTQLVKDKKLGK